MLFNTRQKMQAIKTLMRKVQNFFLFQTNFQQFNFFEEEKIQGDFKNQICVSTE